MRINSSARRLLRWAAAGIVIALAAGCSGGGMTPQAGGVTPQGTANQAALQSIEDAAYVAQQIAMGNFIQACPNVVFGEGRCFALGLKETARAPRSEAGADGSVAGYGPSQLQAAYNITSAAKNDSGGRVAVVEAGGDPNLEKDLAVYRKQFGLPRCDVVSGCLRIENQDGKIRPHPPVIDGWLAEQSLDVDMVSANCPNCKILVVEASTSLGVAERTAARAHPVAISNSWGSEEFKGEKPSEHRLFDHPGIAITASAGDGGYGVIFPSAANTVTAVGGTSLYTAKNSRGYTETVWAGTGSGCSQYIPETSWQLPIEQKLGGCSNRIVSDVAYIADPNTGVAVYESIPGDGEAPGWQVWGGTSVGSPAIAAIYALSGDTTGIPASIAYANPSDLYNVTSGSNGNCAPYDYLCNGEVGYNGPTGFGTPDGLGAF
jgi:subtilase family serine protease